MSLQCLQQTNTTNDLRLRIAAAVQHRSAERSPDPGLGQTHERQGTQHPSASQNRQAASGRRSAITDRRQQVAEAEAFFAKPVTRSRMRRLLREELDIREAVSSATTEVVPRKVV